MLGYGGARELFEAAREAALDAGRAGAQLAAMQRRAEGVGGGGFEGRVHSTPDPDRVGRAVAALVDHGALLEERQRRDYALMGRACSLLYGPDGRGGLWALVGWPADAIYHHYLGLLTWPEVASMLGYSEQHVRRMASAALDLADANGEWWTGLGQGMAE